MKTIKIFSLASTLFFLTFFLNPTFSLATNTDTEVSIVSSESDYVVYVVIDGVRYKYTYTEDGRLIIAESEE